MSRPPSSALPIEVIVENGNTTSRSASSALRPKSRKKKSRRLRQHSPRSHNSVHQSGPGTPPASVSNSRVPSGGVSTTTDDYTSYGEDDEDSRAAADSDSIIFNGIACGNAHTLLLANNSVFAFGNHRYGQLGIDERKKKQAVEMCTNCSVLQASKECKECQEDAKKKSVNKDAPSVFLCTSCDTTVHARRATRYHTRTVIPPPPNRRFKCDIVPVLVKSKEIEFGLDPFPKKGPEETEADWRQRTATHHRVMCERAFDEPTPASALEDIALVTDIACGDSHSVAIVQTPGDPGRNLLFAWGCGSSGRTGLSTISADDDDGWVEEPHTSDEFFGRLVVSFAAAQRPPAPGAAPTDTAADPAAVTTDLFAEPFAPLQVACGGQHTLAVCDGGRLYSFGNGEHGQLGRPTGTVDHFSHAPTEVWLPPAVSVDLVACGDLHSLFLASSGAVFSWGHGGNGRLGHGDTAGHPAPREIEWFKSVDPAARIVHIAGGACHSAAVAADGALFVWGRNDSGQCGPFELPAPPARGQHGTAVSAGERLKVPRPPDKLWPDRIELAPVDRRRPRPATAPSATDTDSEGSSVRRAATVTARTSVSVARSSARRLPGSHAGRPSMQLSSRLSSQAGGRPPSDSQRSGRATLGGGGGASSSGGGGGINDEPPAPPQVACGQCHTLAMALGKLWVLGSGLDLKPRLRDVEIEQEDGHPDRLRLAACFVPREVTTAFVDTAEVSTRPAEWDEGGPDGSVFDRVRHSRIPEERKAEDGDDGEDAPKEPIWHDVFTFTFDGDFDVHPGDEVAFTGPRAPDGLRLYSATDGPFFPVLGKTRRSHLAKWSEVAGPDLQPGEDGLWDSENKIKAPQRFSIECPTECLTPALSDFEAVARWITENATTSNDSNMVVCKRGPVPPLARVASGAFHACALTRSGDVLVWGRGGLGRLGTGNELDQLTPTILEVDAADIGTTLTASMELELLVASVSPQYSHLHEDLRRRAAAGADTAPIGEDLEVGGVVEEIARMPVSELGELALDRLRDSRRLMRGLAGTRCRLVVRRNPQPAEGGMEGGTEGGEDSGGGVVDWAAVGGGGLERLPAELEGEGGPQGGERVVIYQPRIEYDSDE